MLKLCHHGQTNFGQANVIVEDCFCLSISSLQITLERSRTRKQHNNVSTQTRCPPSWKKDYAVTTGLRAEYLGDSNARTCASFHETSGLKCDKLQTFMSILYRHVLLLFVVIAVTLFV